MAQAPDALALAYRYLNRRERTSAELHAHLQNKGCEADDIDAALRELHELGFLDDARYARLFVEDKRTLEHWGAERITRSLQERGVDRDLIEQALATAGGESELDRAMALLRRRFPDAPRERRDRDRALGMLVRKGYDPELALDALAAYARDARHPSFQ